jgi:UDPglucose 6-dehydrogenase
MNITVLGLWHLGCVTAACCAKHFDVIGLDFTEVTVANLREGKAPLFEPGLDDLIQAGAAAQRLRFTSDPAEACRTADVLWVAIDTPVDDNDRADVESVLQAVRRCVPHLPSGALVLLSSQLPVGTARALELEFGAQGYRFACTPENLRLGKAIQIFTQPDRVVVGHRDERSKVQLTALFQPFTSNIVWMRPESAEMTKHAINSFLALSITFMNELSCFCERIGADAKEVERGLKSESRIGPAAYLSPGGAFAGGTLARDVVTCIELSKQLGEGSDIFPAILASNDRHRQWAHRKLAQHFAASPTEGGPIALLGLTYKPGTNTLRRSSAIELARALHAQGFKVAAFDPVIHELPADLNFISLHPDVPSLLGRAAALVVCTEWPEFQRRDDWPQLVTSMRGRVVVDATRFLWTKVSALPDLTYLTVGSPQ